MPCLSITHENQGFYQTCPGIGITCLKRQKPPADLIIQEDTSPSWHKFHPHSGFSASQAISLALKKQPVQSGLHPPHIRKKIFAYTKTLPNSNGLVQLQDKIVVRFALTIYPYSLGILMNPPWFNCTSTMIFIDCKLNILVWWIAFCDKHKSQILFPICRYIYARTHTWKGLNFSHHVGLVQFAISL